MNKIEKNIMMGMVSVLNEASDRYYNASNPIMTDEQFDARLEDLRQFEKETGFVFTNSPTQNVGAKVLTKLKKATLTHPMLSFEKCHSVEDIVKFANSKDLVVSIKLNGVGVSLTYVDGFLKNASTKCFDITEHIKQFTNVPLKIDKSGTYIVRGEAIITNEDFAEINKDGEYKNSKNLTDKTLSELNTSLVGKRRIKFFVWDVIGGCSDTLFENLYEVEELGFDVVPYWYSSTLNPKKLESNIEHVFECAKEDGLPCDGVVFKFNDIEYGESLGVTNNIFKNGIIYKVRDDMYESELIDV